MGIKFRASHASIADRNRNLISKQKISALEFSKMIVFDSLQKNIARTTFEEFLIFWQKIYTELNKNSAPGQN